MLADFVDGADIGMVQRGSSLCFTVETARVLVGLARTSSGQELQSNEAVELRVLGFVDNAHPAAAEFFEDAVVRDGLPNQE